ncbi:cell division protein FtsI [bacterium]|nr:cell division protein FtsI [bacterium]
MDVKERIRRLAYIYLALFFVPLLGVSRYAFFECDEYANHRDNHYNMTAPALRGSILDCHFRPMAYMHRSARVYPLGEAAAPLLGYYSRIYGEAGLESALNKKLLGNPIPRDPWAAYKIWKKGGRKGDDIVLTVDSDLQKKAFEALGGYKGAAAVMSVRDGSLLALASAPSYNPEEKLLEENWEEISRDEEAARLLNRSIQGLYPPGSTFKVLIMSGCLEDGFVSANESFNCEGKDLVVNFVLNCSAVHGKVSLKEALGYSCNVAFGRMGLRMQMEGIRKWMRAFRMDDPLKDVPGAAQAVLPTVDTSSAPAETAIGQGDTLVSPLHMARIAAVIANKGLDVEPHLLREQLSGSDAVWRYEPEKAQRVISKKNAALVAEAMEFTVREGTGMAAYIPGVRVAGKTGSAENPHGKVHAWFIGYAPAEDPKVAVSVILENAGGGGKFAAPVAREIMKAALELPEFKSGKK